MHASLLNPLPTLITARAKTRGNTRYIIFIARDTGAVTDNRFISRSCNDTEYPLASRTTSCFPGRPFPPDKSSDYRIILARFSSSSPFPLCRRTFVYANFGQIRTTFTSVLPVLYNVTHRRDKTAHVASSCDPRVHVVCLGSREISITHFRPP